MFYFFIETGMLENVKANGGIVKSFTYNNGILTKVNNNDIIYDRYGNITKIGDVTIKYNSRGLMESYSYKDNSNNQVEYKYYYNYQGARYKKEKYLNSVIKEDSIYYLNASTILGEDKRTYNNGQVQTTKKLRYYYDAEGICGVKYDNKNYVLVKDPLGNVSKVLCNGYIIGEYLYDAWGNHHKVDSNTSSNTDKELMNNNPFRYKGYYYDVETNLFLVSSRYYSPELCRWISPDDIEYLDPESVNGLNLYCYCFNDPINYIDPDGHAPWWSWALSGLQLVGGIALCFVPGMQGLGASLAIGGAAGLIMNALEPQIAQAIGGVGSMANGYGAISTGANLMSLGGWASVAGFGLILIGAGTMAFGANEVVDAFTGTNYIQEWTGMGDTAYAWSYLGLNLASSIGTGLGQRYVQVRNRTVTYNPDGSVKQYRYYKNGSKLYDVDFNHAGKMKFPHYHGWLRDGTRLGKNHPGYIIMLLQLFGRIFR